VQGPVFYKNEWVSQNSCLKCKTSAHIQSLLNAPTSGEKWVSNGRKQFSQAKEFSVPNCLYRIEVHSICMDTIVSNAQKIKWNEQEMSEWRRNSFRRQKDSVPPNLLHQKNFGDSARQIFSLAETISYHHSVIYCSFLPDFWWRSKGDCMCADAVHCKCEIWSLIIFIGNWSKSALSACSMRLGAEWV